MSGARVVRVCEGARTWEVMLPELKTVLRDDGAHHIVHVIPPFDAGIVHENNELLYSHDTICAGLALCWCTHADAVRVIPYAAGTTEHTSGRRGVCDAIDDVQPGADVIESTEYSDGTVLVDPRDGTNIDVSSPLRRDPILHTGTPPDVLIQAVGAGVLSVEGLPRRAVSAPRTDKRTCTLVSEPALTSPVVEDIAEMADNGATIISSI